MSLVVLLVPGPALLLMCSRGIFYWVLINMKLFIKASFTAVVALLLVACTAENKLQNAQAMPAAVPVKVGSPVAKKVNDWAFFYGHFRPAQRAEIRARVTGYVDRINFDDGQVVRQGETLFVIDQRPFINALDVATAQYELAKSEYEKVDKLRATQAVSEELFEQRYQEYRVANAALNDAKLNLEYTEIKAPFMGRVGRNLIDVGNLISQGSGTVLTTLVTTDPMEFYFEVSESEMLSYTRARMAGEAEAERGDPYPVEIRLQDESGFVHKGMINFLDNEISMDTGTIEVRAVFENTNGLFEPGMFAELRLARRPPFDGLVIPQHIVGTELNRKFVYALDENNLAYRKYITLGAITDLGEQIVESGLVASDRIVMGGLHMVRPGVTIQPLPVDGDSPGQ